MASGIGHVTLEMVTSEVEVQVHSGCVLNNIHIANYVLMFEGMPHTPLFLTEVSLAYASFSDTLCERHSPVLDFGRIGTLLNAQPSSVSVALTRE